MFDKVVASSCRGNGFLIDFLKQNKDCYGQTPGHCYEAKYVVPSQGTLLLCIIYKALNVIGSRRCASWLPIDQLPDLAGVPNFDTARLRYFSRQHAHAFLLMMNPQIREYSSSMQDVKLGVPELVVRCHKCT